MTNEELADQIAALSTQMEKGFERLDEKIDTNHADLKLTVRATEKRIVAGVLEVLNPIMDSNDEEHVAMRRRLTKLEEKAS